jgi:hypothetical protein
MGPERAQRETKWSRVRIGPPGSAHYIRVKPIDPEVMKQMPPEGSKTFISMNMVDYVVWRFKKLLHPYDDIPF